MSWLGALGGVVSGAGTGLLAGAKLAADRDEFDKKLELMKAEIVAKFAVEDRKDARLDKEIQSREAVALMRAGIDPDTGEPLAGGKVLKGKSSRGGGRGGVDLSDPSAVNDAAALAKITGPAAAEALDFQRTGTPLPSRMGSGGLLAAALERIPEDQRAEVYNEMVDKALTPGQKEGFLNTAQKLAALAEGKDAEKVVEGIEATQQLGGEKTNEQVNAARASRKGDLVKEVGEGTQLKRVDTGAPVGAKNPKTFAPKESAADKPETAAEIKRKENAAKAGAQLAAQTMARRGLVQDPNRTKSGTSIGKGDRQIPLAPELVRHAEVLAEYGLSSGEIGTLLGATERKNGGFVNPNFGKNKKTGRWGYLMGSKFYPVE